MCKGLDLEVSYEYKDRNSTLTTVQVSKYTSKVNDVTSAEYTYTYDSRGNITKITDSAGNITKYTYDDLSQLTREDNPYLNKTYLYTYDNAGNRTSKKTYTYTTGSLASLTPTSTQAYTYSTGAWGDRLSGTTYDGIGNPLTYSTYALTWSGRELVEMNRNYGQSVTSFTYNDEGIRTSKNVGGTVHAYVLNGSQIVSETWGQRMLLYLYDESGAPLGLQYRQSSYAAGVFDTFYFEKNIFGDIVAVYAENGQKIGTYTYDAWGNCTTTVASGNTTLQSTILRTYNPFRYRGYFYDTETGLYYLQSRYYNPATGRFLNPDNHDVLWATPTELTDKNLYAYCDNNPVMRTDETGEFWIQFLIGAVVGLTSEIFDFVTSGEDFTWQVAAQMAVSTFGGGLSACVGPVGGALISGMTNGLNSRLEGNTVDTAYKDAIVGTTTSLLGSGVQFLVGRTYVADFMKTASKTSLKTLANNLGYAGRNFKNISTWTGKIVIDASILFMDRPFAQLSGFVVSGGLEKLLIA